MERRSRKVGARHEQVRAKHLRFSLILGSEKQRIRAAYTPADIYVINRENVVWLVDYLRNAWNFDMVVIDESSSFKNHRAKRFKALTWIRPHVSRIVELTGTPSPNVNEGGTAIQQALDHALRRREMLPVVRGAGRGLRLPEGSPEGRLLPA